MKESQLKAIAVRLIVHALWFKQTRAVYCVESTTAETFEPNVSSNDDFSPPSLETH